MNIKEYISTGIVETYVLGEATPSQREEFERLLEQHQELKEELALVEKTLEALAVSGSISPRKSSRESIIESVVGRSGKVVSLESARPRYALAASIALAILSSAFALYFYSRWQTTAFALDTLVAQNQQIANDYNTVNQKLDKIQSDLSIIESAAFTRVVMKGTDNAPGAMASVYWNKQSEEVFVSIQNLRQLTSSSQYQLWAMVDGHPVDMGVFDYATGLIAMKSIRGATAFAVTVEPRGGVSSPTLITMQVIGMMPNS